jgi:lysophospholipase L1-like esterase
MNQLRFVIASFSILAGITQADTLYIGDAASEGATLVAPTDSSYTLNTLTIVMHTGSPVIYTAPGAQNLKLTKVNFYAHESGTVTPFVALFSGDPATGSAYKILAIGDPISTAGGSILVNAAFTVSGINPTISIQAGDKMVAGFLEQGRVVYTDVGGQTGIADYIFNGNSLSGQSVSNPLSANSTYNAFDNKMKFNIGFDLIPPTLQIAKNQTSQAGNGEQPLLSFSASATDLAQAGSAAILTNTFSGATFFGTPAELGNGLLSNAGGGVYLSETFGGGFLPNTQTIVFNTTVNTAGYNIAGITTYAGHSENGSALANQKYNLEYRQVGSANFTSLGLVSHTPYDNANTDLAAATRIAITDSTGTIATGVDAIRITYLSHGFTNGNPSVDGTLYKEVDVFGTAATVPAPALELGDIWFIGDSITQSNADGAANSSPRKSLYDLLKPKNVNFTYTGHFADNVDGLPASGDTAETNLYHYHSGVSGIRIGNATDGVIQNLPSNWGQGRIATVKPEIILIMLGTNDVLGDVNADTAPARLSELIDDIMSFSGVGRPTVFVSTIPPSKRGSGETARALAFNTALPDVIAAQRIAGRDIYLVDAFTPLNANYASTMQSDGIHPNATGNGVIGQVWYDAIMHRFAPEPGKNYSDWQIDNFGSTLATAAGERSNPDGDLGNNFYEFAYGGNPNVADDNVRMPVDFDGIALRIARRKPISASLVYRLEKSSTLEALSWNEVTDDSIKVLSTNGDFERVEYTRSAGFTGSTRNFYRLSVKQASP